MKTPAQMLDEEFEHNDFDGPVSFRQFFQELVKAVWTEEEGFSGKRPFGNSGWQQPVYEALGSYGVKRDDADAFIDEMIEEL